MLGLRRPSAVGSGRLSLYMDSCSFRASGCSSRDASGSAHDDPPTPEWGFKQSGLKAKQKCRHAACQEQSDFSVLERLMSFVVSPKAPLLGGLLLCIPL